jgi:hypothetical protein
MRRPPGSGGRSLKRRREWENTVRPLSTAIVHLRKSPAGGPAWDDVSAACALLSGVRSVRYEVDEAIVAVRFDRRAASMADIVRVLEDFDASVASVAQRDPSRKRRRRCATPSFMPEHRARRLVR